MVVPDEIRKCVVFVGLQRVDGQFQLAGTAFYLGRSISGSNLSASYLVTAKHVITGIRSLGLEDVCLRMNFKDGTAKWFKVSIALWRFHPSDQNADVAILPIALHPDFDHLMMPISLIITPDHIKHSGIGVGDEVVITGLFRHHHGKNRNIPVVRVGNIAAMDEEQVVTRDFGLISAFLIEARSIGGLSGSPVFVNLGVTRLIEGEAKFSKAPMMFLLGLIHGHFDLSEGKIDSSSGTSVASVNMGIAIVIPYYKIVEVLNHPDFVSNENLIRENWNAQTNPTIIEEPKGDS